LGLSSVPRAGDSFISTDDDRTARQIAEKRDAIERNAAAARGRKRISLEDFTKALAEGKVDMLNLILKGDVSGAVEALEDSLLKIDVGDEVDLRIIHRGVGAITENDINLATVDNAIVIGFNVRPEAKARDLADREGVDVRYYSVIYQAIDDIESSLKGMLKPEYEEVQIGTAEIREVFRSSKFGNIAGSIVRDGLIKRNSTARVTRDGVVIGGNVSIESLRRFKDDATEVREGYECGIGLGKFNDLRVGDIIETFEMQEKPRDLSEFAALVPVDTGRRSRLRSVPEGIGRSRFDRTATIGPENRLRPRHKGYAPWQTRLGRARSPTRSRSSSPARSSAGARTRASASTRSPTYACPAICSTPPSPTPSSATARTSNPRARHSNRPRASSAPRWARG